MKTNELKITIPQGQEIDWKESAKQEKIVFRKKDTKPRSWEEYCSLEAGFDCVGIDWKCGGVQPTPQFQSFVPTNLAPSFIAMMQLMSLRQAWIGDWKPDWSNCEQRKAVICCGNDGNFHVLYFRDLISRPLSFPTNEMAEHFMDCFKDLLEIAKPLI